MVRFAKTFPVPALLLVLAFVFSVPAWVWQVVVGVGVAALLYAAALRFGDVVAARRRRVPLYD